MSDLQHPGIITYSNKETGEEWSESADKAPEQVRFADGVSGKVPVVRIEFSAAGNQTFVKEFGPAGQLLRSTVGFR